MIDHAERCSQRLSFALVKNARIALGAEIAAKDLGAVKYLDLEALFQRLVDRLQGNHVHNLFLARYEDRTVTDFAHPKSNKIDDRIIFSATSPCGDVLIIDGVINAVQVPQIERT